MTRESNVVSKCEHYYLKLWVPVVLFALCHVTRLTYAASALFWILLTYFRFFCREKPSLVRNIKVELAVKPWHLNLWGNIGSPSVLYALLLHVFVLYQLMLMCSIMSLNRTVNSATYDLFSIDWAEHKIQTSSQIEKVRSCSKFPPKIWSDQS